MLIGKNIKAVLFDHDDTLVGTIEAKWAQHKHIAKKHYNKELLDEEIRQHWGKPLRTLLGLLYETEDVEEALSKVMKIHHDFPKRLFDSTLGVIQELRERGMLVGVVTASSRGSFDFDIDNLGIPGSFFDYSQTEEDTQYHKPDPRVFEPAIEWLSGHGISPSEVLYVGDSLNDMQAAKGAGFDFVGVQTGLTKESDFKNNSSKTIGDLGQLIK